MPTSNQTPFESKLERSLASLKRKNPDLGILKSAAETLDTLLVAIVAPQNLIDSLKDQNKKSEDNLETKHHKVC